MLSCFLISLWNILLFAATLLILSDIALAGVKEGEINFTA